MIQVKNLSKSFASHTLFENINFQINKDEKVGLIGRNGFGKTTLFRILIGLEEADSGEIVIPRNYSIGYVKQELNFIKNNVLEEGALGLPEDQKNELWLAEKILFGLGFDKISMNADPKLLSGGFQVRLNLAKALLSDSNMLLLDEPTNYLDITSIRWLINFLKIWKGELLLITHDRSFMDQIVSNTMIIHRKNVKKIEGNTEKLYDQIAQEEEIYERQRINDEKKRKQVEIFINRFRAKARLAGLVQSRVKELNKHDKKAKLEKIKTLDFRFRSLEFKADILMEIEDLSFGYDKLNFLINNLNFTINKRDRIAVVGPNGKGKSTLLKLLHNDLQPVNGEIKKHNLLKNGYFGQTNNIKMHPEHTVEEEIALSHPDNDYQESRNICGALLFEQDNALKKIKVLSGGEKSRVLLGKILVNPVNLLLLDEPTNHLDMQSCDALLAAIDDFDGAVVIVTHNEMFLHAVAERLIVFDGGKVFTYEGRYKDFIDKVGWDTENDKDGLENDKNNSTSSINKKELRKIRAKLIEEKSKVLKPIEKKYHNLEQTVENMERQLENLNNKIIEASTKGDGNKIGELSKKVHEMEKEIKEKYDELEDIMILFEEKSKYFEEKMK